jgi:hypothetical protein
VLVLLFVIFLVIPFVLAVQAAVLRGAVDLTNAILGGREPQECDYELAGPMLIPQLKTTHGMRIPKPTTAQAVGIVLLTSAINFVLQLTLVLVQHGVKFSGGLGGVNKLAGQMADQSTAMVSMTIGSVVSVLVLKAMLPTSAGRAVVVAVCQCVIVVALLLGLGFLVGSLGLVPR